MGDGKKQKHKNKDRQVETAAADATAKLKRKGITMVNLKGGLLGWVHAGGPLVRGNLPVRVLHVYGRKWDLAPAGIETVY